MEHKYNIEEILNAINDLERLKKAETKIDKAPKKDDTEIPKNTLKLIIEAEKINN